MRANQSINSNQTVYACLSRGLILIHLGKNFRTMMIHCRRCPPPRCIPQSITLYHVCTFVMHYMLLQLHYFLVSSESCNWLEPFYKVCDLFTRAIRLLFDFIENPIYESSFSILRIPFLYILDSILLISRSALKKTKKGCCQVQQ